MSTSVSHVSILIEKVFPFYFTISLLLRRDEILLEKLFLEYFLTINKKSEILKERKNHPSCGRRKQCQANSFEKGYKSRFIRNYIDLIRYLKIILKNLAST